jgi:hypothetical protein
VLTYSLGGPAGILISIYDSNNNNILNTNNTWQYKINSSYTNTTYKTLYRTQNYGVTWTATNAPPLLYNDIIISETGQNLVVCSDISYCQLMSSENYGMDWEIQYVPTFTGDQIKFVYTSQEGTYVYAISSVGRKYRGYYQNQ